MYENEHSDLPYNQFLLKDFSDFSNNETAFRAHKLTLLTLAIFLTKLVYVTSPRSGFEHHLLE